MSRLHRIQLLTTTIGLALGVVVYFLLVPITVSDTSSLEGTILSTPGLPQFSTTPSFSGDLPTARLPVAAMVASGKSDPVHTGAWAKQWYPSGARVTDSLQLQSAVTPTVAVAKTVLSQSEHNLLTKAAITADKHKYIGSVPIAPLVGSAAEFVIPAIHQKATATQPALNTAAEPGFVIVFRVGRAVVQETISGPVATKATALGVANREATRIAQAVPTLTPFQVRRYPAGSTIVVIAVTLAVVLIAAFVPVGIEAGRRRRLAEIAARADRHRRVRGAKALKSQRRRF